MRSIPQCIPLWLLLPVGLFVILVNVFLFLCDYVTDVNVNLGLFDVFCLDLARRLYFLQEFYLVALYKGIVYIMQN